MNTTTTTTTTRREPSQAVLKARPHTCCERRFDSHDSLAFHLVREHLVRLSEIGRCYVDCPMLAKNETLKATS